MEDKRTGMYIEESGSWQWLGIIILILIFVGFGCALGIGLGYGNGKPELPSKLALGHQYEVVSVTPVQKEYWTIIRSDEMVQYKIYSFTQRYDPGVYIYEEVQGTKQLVHK